jgi:uncharacterized protein with ParB-like and HNH nuclease domain
MKASETKFQPIIEGTKQYVVPLFQRAYSWDKKEWDVLWDDLVYLCENEEPKSHFIGSIVTMPTVSVPEGVAKYLLIDGQQRITTIFVLLMLLRDKAKEAGNDELANEIQQTMLVNPFKKGHDYFKLLPTQADRSAFQSLVQRVQIDDQSQVYRCYQFFSRKLSQKTIGVQELTKVITNRFSVVSIVLDSDDNPHLVFESLNAKGQKLTQADLIRNYFFMRIHVEEQAELYNKYWAPMQSALRDNLTECIRHYMMRNGSFVKQTDVYFTLKDRIGESDALKALNEIYVFAGYYQKLVDPMKEKDLQIRASITRLNRLEVTTAYPFLLNCYHDYMQEQLSYNDFVKILKILENFVIRRYVCNIPTSHLNKLFPYLYDWAKAKDTSNFVDAVRLTLQSRDYPRDAQFRSRLMDAKLYGYGERAVKTKLILETLEDAYQHKEQVPYDNLTIEHVMPQTQTEWWQQHLGEDWQVDYELCLHTLGNLTLTGYNSELSNESFPKKQQLLAESHLQLNKYFQGITKWDRAAIEKRSEVLADLALTIWPYFGDTQAFFVPDTVDAATGKTPKYVTILGQRFTVDSWRSVLRRTIATIADVVPEGFAKLMEEYPHFISSTPERFKKYSQLDNGYYLNVYLNARDVYRFCTQAIEAVGLSREDWVVETE